MQETIKTQVEAQLEAIGGPASESAGPGTEATGEEETQTYEPVAYVETPVKTQNEAKEPSETATADEYAPPLSVPSYDAPVMEE